MRLISKETKAIADKASKRKGRMNQTVPNGIFLAALMFVIAFICILFSWVAPWLKWFYHGDESWRIIIVNADHDLVDYCSTSERGEYIIYKQWSAPYDYVTFGDWMHENDAFITVVFPDGYTEDMINPSTPSPEVLTFYRTNSLRYMEWKEEYVIDGILNPYQDYVKAKYGITTPVNENLYVEQEVLTGNNGNNWGELIARGLSTNVYPLILFIILLYVGMSVGTDVIAGEKERGTFSAILLSPIPRRSIIVGNVIGTCRKALIPATVAYVLMTAASIPYSLSPISMILGVMLLMSLCVLISAITITISSLNSNVVSAQTAFLPVFLVMISVAVTCIQNVKDPADFYFFIPIYGHFYSLGLAFMGEVPIISAIICLVITTIISLLIIKAATAIIGMERFTSSSGSVSAKEIRKAKALLAKKKNDYVSKPRHSMWGYTPRKRTSKIGFIIDQIFYPLGILSLFQLLALIPTVIAYMRKPEYSAFIYSLKNVKTMPAIIDKVFEVMGIFLSDPMFLVFMSISYLMIIFCYMTRVRIREKGRMSTLGLTKVGTSYLKGILIGFVLMTSVFVILTVSGQIKPSLNSLSLGSVGTILAGLLMWIPQGAAEEVMFRGFMLPRQSARFGLRFAVIFSSLLFAGFHSMNVGFSWLAFVNLFLIAVLFALIDIRAGHIWYTCGAHTVWNFLQGNVYGLQVSGNQGAAAVFDVKYSSSASDIITGGAFGPEGGLAVTAVTVVGIIVILILNRRSRGRQEQSPS